MRGTRTLAAIFAASLAISSCSSDDKKAETPPKLNEGSSSSSKQNGSGKTVPEKTEDAAFTAGGSIGRIWVTDATNGQELTLVDAENAEVAVAKADELGSVIFRDLEAGDGYSVRAIDGDTVAGTGNVSVLEPGATPDSNLYDQEVVEGLNYVKMRDGIELAVTVRPPMGKKITDGPFPTIIEYSGYQVAAPGDLLGAAVGAVTSGAGLSGLEDPLLPATSTAVGSLIAPLLGYASVSVQMRGSGCSGGAFDLFDYPTTYDGYDVIETVARQDWVLGNKVGMGGISFSGITQLMVAGTKPPSLAAISPLSVTDDIYAGTGYPGGIFNNGFAQTWLEERQENARPAPAEGAQPYAIALVNDGDQHCIDNQKLRLQTQDINELIEDNPFKDPELTDHRSAFFWADEIEVPVFLVGALNDEQTGPRWPELIDELDENPNVWVTMQNGTHVDALGPNTVSRWVEFLDLFVADRIPAIPALVTGLGGELYKAVANGSASKPIPATRFDSFTDVEAARAEFKKDPRIRVIFDNGGGAAGPGALEGVWETSFDSFPVKDANATSFFLGADGALSEDEPSDSSEVSYTGDPSARPATTLPGDGEADAWAALPPVPMGTRRCRQGSWIHYRGARC